MGIEEEEDMPKRVCEGVALVGQMPRYADDAFSLFVKERLGAVGSSSQLRLPLFAGLLKQVAAEWCEMSSFEKAKYENL